MSSSVSFHPVPVELIQTRLLPYLAGEGDIDDVVASAARVARNQARARAWGLAVVRERERLLSQHTKNKTRKLPTWAKNFDQNLHLLGRPFFITVERPDQVSRAIDQYLKASSAEEVDTLARNMIAQLDEKLAEKLQPFGEEKLAADDELQREITQDLDNLREICRGKTKKTATLIPAGAHGSDNIANYFVHVLLRFVSFIRPGWTASAEIRPAYALTPYFEPLASIFDPLGANLPHLHEKLRLLADVGGVVPPDKVTEFRLHLEDNAGNYRKTKYHVDYQKLLEAVMDAEREFMGFIEIADVDQQ